MKIYYTDKDNFRVAETTLDNGVKVTISKNKLSGFSNHFRIDLLATPQEIIDSKDQVIEMLNLCKGEL